MIRLPHPCHLLITALLLTPLHAQNPTTPKKKPTQTTTKKTPAKKPLPHKPLPKSTAKSTAKSKSAAHLHVYKTGHGNQGFGTLKTPPRYAAPLPPVVPEPAPLHPAATGARAIDFSSELDPFFTQLAALESGADPQTTLRILQFGDSHTAADMFTGRMRSLFQSKFGNGGAGFSFAGHPFAGYRILGTSRSQSPGWLTEGVHFTQIVDTDLGLGGVAQTSTRPGETISLEAPCTRFQLLYLDQPGGGAFSLSDGGHPVATISTDNTLAPETLSSECEANEPAGSGIDVPPHPYPGIGTLHDFTLTSTSSAPVRLFGFVTEQPGITYEALGLNGAEASLILRWNQPIFTSYLRQRDPALIVLAYGTNEAGNHNWTYETYRDLMGRLIDQLHATVPNAAILVIGPPDRSTRIGRGRHAAWSTFTQTLHITDAQRDACKTHGCAFWSWRDRMGGLGSMNHWVANGLAQPDHTHFTSAGYVQLADFLYSDLLSAYADWKSTQNPATRR